MLVLNFVQESGQLIFERCGTYNESDSLCRPRVTISNGRRSACEKVADPAVAENL